MSYYLPFVSQKPLKKLFLHLTLWVFGFIFVLSIVIYLAVKFSPWPSALIVRTSFEQQAWRISQTLEKHVPADVYVVRNLHYSANDKALTLDIFYPAALKTSQQNFPVLVWVHGGGWVSGSKNDLANYAKIFAAQGFAVVAIDYSLAPERTYPTPVREINTALAYLARNTKPLRLENQSWFLAGNVSGAHIAAQLAAAISEPDYAKTLGMQAALAREQLAGVVLYGGIYDFNPLNLDTALDERLKIMLWAYSGTKNFSDDAAFSSASLLALNNRAINTDFPPAFISASNANPLEKQSRDLAQALTARGVVVDSLFFPAEVQPVHHDSYPFNLDTPAGQLALRNSLKFLKARSTHAPPSKVANPSNIAAPHNRRR